MKARNTWRFILIGIAVMGVVGCAKVKRPQAADEHDAWQESLNDSIAKYQNIVDSINILLPQIHSEIETSLSDFQYVNNPKMVEGYYIVSSWASKYPLTSTGLLARITESETIEISACLSKGRFTHISLSSGGDQYTSPPVSHDQAFNYATSSFDRVCFSGGVADSIADFITSHENQKINVTFIENSATGNFSLPEGEKQMVASTWNLYTKQRMVKELQKNISLYSAKIDACRKILVANDSISQ